jgi:hypothetical protein
MARLAELAIGIAKVLKVAPQPEPLFVDIIDETLAAATVVVYTVVEACLRDVCPLSMVAIDPELGEGLLNEYPLDYEGVALFADNELYSRIAFYRFPPG